MRVLHRLATHTGRRFGARGANSRRFGEAVALSAGLCVGAAGWWLHSCGTTSKDEERGELLAWCQSPRAQPEPNPKNCGVFVKGLPEYTLEEVAAHRTLKGPKPSVWVVFQAGVYDITDFVMKHPGGDKRIMLAAGGSVEKFWQLYTQHNDDAVRTILERYRIGNLKDYVAPSRSSTDDSETWANQPRRSPGLVVLNERPFNAETPEAILDQFITPNELFYVRNHMPVPDLSAKDFCVLVDGEGVAQHCFTVEQLKKLFPEHTVTTTMQCGGNRRGELAAGAAAGSDKPVKGLSWAGGAIGTAKWTGVRMGDVIRYCQRRPSRGRSNSDGLVHETSQYHVQLFGADKDIAGSFAVSIPYHKATAADEDTIIAFKMNDEEIPRDHGYPMRAIVPGVVGVRNCKWLSRISVQPEEAQTVWQQQDYKNFPSWASAPDPSLPSVMAMPVQSVVVNAEHDTSADVVRVRGYAYCGGGTPLQRVELSLDGGKSFMAAANLLRPSLAEEPQQAVARAPEKWWAWRQFEAELDVADRARATMANNEGKFVVCSRAVTIDNHQQPATPNYNFRGLLNNSVSCRETVEK